MGELRINMGSQNHELPDELTEDLKSQNEKPKLVGRIGEKEIGADDYLTAARNVLKHIYDKGDGTVLGEVTSISKSPAEGKYVVEFIKNSATMRRVFERDQLDTQIGLNLSNIAR